jgi:RHS repeat-associated protein
MQAMLYSYDQLHRIRESRSLTTYSSANGFTARSTTPAAYDEDYTYDGNGNLLTLVRRDAQAVVKDNFTYGYYANSNKLRQLVPVERDATYTGQLHSDSKVYQNITIQDGSYVASGTNVQLKASDYIDIDPAFDVQANGTFDAYVLGDDEGMYLYDAIGNLVWDQEEGVRISWTPYGKIREVVRKNSTTVSFLYDATGNRIAKKITNSEGTTTTRYVRDASGNVLSISKDENTIEQPIYGSSRVGKHVPGRMIGHRSLGERSLEMSNHLGNVLTVVLDNVFFTSAVTTTKVVSVNDYYPFGLDMDGRKFSEESYRYGFNGKEKDSGEEFGDNVYDYGFRIYNPRTAKFLSVDPLTQSYPWYTPYQFAGNMPTYAVDLDGCEEIAADEIWRYAAYGSTEVGIVDENYIPVRNQEGIFFMHKVTTGVNKGHYLARQFHGRFSDGTPIYTNSYIVGDKAFKEFSSRDYEGGPSGAFSSYWFHQAGHGLGGAKGGLKTMDWSQYYYDQWTNPENLVAGASLGVMALRNNLTRQSVDEKLSKYLLNKDHPIGGSKAKWFDQALGFTKDNADDLAKQIVFDPKKAVQTEVTQYGIKFNQVISIKGANGKEIDVTFSWIKNKDGVTRLVTGIPSKKM